MSWPAKPFYLFAALLFACSSLSGCTKGDELNVDLPGTAAIGTSYVDLPVTVATVRQPIIQTLKAEHYLAGRLTDNLTGSTEARAVLNLEVGVNDSLPGRYTTASEPDSVVVTLGYDQVYGSANAPAQLDVLALTTKLDERTVYNSASVAPTGATIFDGRNQPPIQLNRTRPVRQLVATSPGDSITVQVPDRTVRLIVQSVERPAKKRLVNSLSTDSVAIQSHRPAVRSAYANSLFKQLQVYSLTQAQLDAILAGIVLAPTSGYNGAVLSFSRVLSGSINVYFHPTVSQKRHVYQMHFGPSLLASSGPGSPTDPRYYTQLSTSFQTNSALSALQSGSASTRVPSASTDGVTYIQEGTGLATTYSFATTQFNTLLNQPGIAINRAELILPIKPYSNALLNNPARLYAVEVDAKNQTLQRVTGISAVERIVQGDGATQQGRGSESQGVLLNTSSTNIYYDLLVTSYLQAYLTNATAATLGGDLPDALLLTPALSTATSLTLNRATINANDVRLRVYYSKLR